MAQLAMTGMTYPNYRRKYLDPLEGIDVTKEYALIQQKKSQLTASQRRAVVYRMEHNHE